MKLHQHTKKQFIALAVMAVIFVVTVLYSKGYFDLSFVERPNKLPSSQNNSQSQQKHEYETLPEDEFEYGENDYSDEFFGDLEGDYEYNEEFEDELQDFFENMPEDMMGDQETSNLAN